MSQGINGVGLVGAGGVVGPRVGLGVVVGVVVVGGGLVVVWIIAKII